MRSVNLDGEEIVFRPIDEVLELTGITIEEFESAFPRQDQYGPFWSDENGWEKILQLLGDLIPKNVPVKKLPEVPDQLAINLRSELTLLSDTYPLTAEEKDWFEQLLQDALRPVVYLIIQKTVSEKELGEAETEMQSLVENSLSDGLLKIEIRDWSISEVESFLGVVAYRFKGKDQQLFAANSDAHEQPGLWRLGAQFIQKYS